MHPPRLTRQLDEHSIQGRARLVVQRRQVEVSLGQGTQTIVDTGVDVHHVAVLVDKIDGRQETRPLQAVAVQIVRRNVRRGDQRNAAGEQRLQQRGQQHGVSDVGHEEFVEAQHIGFGLEAVSDDFQRVFPPLQLGQLFMHSQHEAVEVQTHFAIARQAMEEHVHQPGFAAPDAAPHIQPLHRALQRRFAALAQQTAELAAQPAGQRARRGLCSRA